MIFTLDSHAHIFEKYYKEGLDEIIEECRTGLSHVLNVACDKAMIMECMSRDYPANFHLAFGFHPHEASSINDQDLVWLKHCLQTTRHIVGLGEIGLDYFKNYAPAADQIRLYEKQILLAVELQLPIIIHCRDAHQDNVRILRENLPAAMTKRILLHCFSGTPEELGSYADFDPYFSFAGPVTYKNNLLAEEVLRRVPLNRLLIETDCPYLSPDPNRGKMNRPIWVMHVLSKISGILGMSETDLNRHIHDNYLSFFGIDAV